MSHQELDSIAIGAMTVIGLGFCVLAFRADQEVDSNCASPLLRYGWTIMQNIGLCVATLGISYYVCTSVGSCYAEASTVGASKRQMSYIVIFLILGLINLVLSILLFIARKGLSEAEKKTCGDSNAADKYVIIAMILSGLLSAVPLGLFVYGIYQSRAMA